MLTIVISGSMKGKGKGMSESKDCPLQFPDLKPVDHTKACPLYASGKSVVFILSLHFKNNFHFILMVN